MDVILANAGKAFLRTFFAALLAFGVGIRRPGAAAALMPSVPGTFKNRPPAPQRSRNPRAALAEEMQLVAGALVAEAWTVGECTVMVGREPVGEPLEGGARGYRWHLSIAHRTRYPTWDEIKTAVHGIPTIPRDVFLAQVVGPGDATGEWVDIHENCFHLYEVHDPALVHRGGL